MKIDITSLDKDRFHINYRSIPKLGNFVLIVPHKAMWSWAEDEVHLRSLLCREDGIVVSSGFPKFFNMGEKPLSDTIVAHKLKNSVITEKADGSLIIASVIDGLVHFRTRGCEVLAEILREDFERIVNDHYPSLLDPANKIYAPGRSVLFEHISLTNRIVVKYDTSHLVLLATSDHSSDKLQIKLADESFLGEGIPKPVKRLASLDDISALKTVVNEYDDREGIVIWTDNNDQVLLTKLKSAWYLRLHALRSQASPRYVKEFCYKNQAYTLDAVKQALMDEGLDWETCEYIEPIFNEMKIYYNNACKKINAVEEEITQLSIRALTTRKDIALAAKDISLRYDGMFSYIMASATNDLELTNDIADSIKLDIPVMVLRKLRKSEDNNDKKENN